MTITTPEALAPEDNLANFLMKEATKLADKWVDVKTSHTNGKI